MHHDFCIALTEDLTQIRSDIGIRFDL